MTTKNPTKKDLIAQIITHDLITCYDTYNYSIEDPISPFRDISFITCNYCLFSDYVGDTVTRSNQRTLYSLLKDLPGVSEMTLGYSGVQTCINCPSLTNWTKTQLLNLLEILDSLTDYPLIDDEDLSNLESEIFSESWDNYIASDIISDLSKLIEIESDTMIDHIEAQRLYDLSQSLNELDYLYLPHKTITSYRHDHHTPLTLSDTYWLYADQTSDYPIYESATSAYIDTEKVAKWIHENTEIIYKPSTQTDITDY